MDDPGAMPPQGERGAMPPQGDPGGTTPQGDPGAVPPQGEGRATAPMRFGLSLMNFDDFADARRVADLARAAEAAGWDALLVWDHLAFAWGPPAGDAWTLVTAAALATDRL